MREFCQLGYSYGSSGSSPAPTPLDPIGEAPIASPTSLGATTTTSTPSSLSGTHHHLPSRHLLSSFSARLLSSNLLLISLVAALRHGANTHPTRGNPDRRALLPTELLSTNRPPVCLTRSLLADPPLDAMERSFPPPWRCDCYPRLSAFHSPARAGIPHYALRSDSREPLNNIVIDLA